MTKDVAEKEVDASNKCKEGVVSAKERTSGTHISPFAFVFNHMKPWKAAHTEREVGAAESKENESKISAGSSTTPDEEKERQLMREMNKALSYNLWYHGMMPRGEIDEMLKNDGDFLLRKTEVSNKPRFAISVMGEGRIRHILIQYNIQESQWALRNIYRKTMTELINDLVKLKIPVLADGTVIKNGIPRPHYYILHDHVEIGEKLGSGSFGDVYSGQLCLNFGQKVDVAIKKLKLEKGKKQRADFVREAKVMRRLQHQNIIKMYGVAPQEEPMLIVMELAKSGGLKRHLQTKTDLKRDHLVKYAKDAVRGLCFLSERMIIHRDIAARNCLLGGDDELKIADFGLSIVDTDEVRVGRLNKMPVKWMSPESLREGIFSRKTDVWSYGVLLWEIFTRCKEDPMAGITNLEAKDKILSGKPPLAIPAEATPIVECAMKMCFIQDPEERCTFPTLFRLLCPGEKLPVP